MKSQPASQRKPRAARWISRCGTVELIRGDSMQLLKSVRDAAAVLTAPPFGVVECAWDVAPDLARLGELLCAATPEHAVWAVFATQPFATDVINAWRKWFRYELVWQKRRVVGFLNANRQPLRSHELMLVFSRRPSLWTYQPQQTPGKPFVSRGATSTKLYSKHGHRVTINTGERHPRSVLEFDESNAGKIHPTQKPLA